MKGTYVRGPKLADVPYPVQMEPSLVVVKICVSSPVPSKEYVFEEG
jgi:hypothetical protein